MTILEMLEQSTILTVLGMSVVFAFLWFMIICMNGVAKMVHKLGWDKDVMQPKNEAPKNTPGTAAPEVTAAITAALAKHRNEKN
jgi:oxaloacetate decarboxylase gamma subunit